MPDRSGSRTLHIEDLIGSRVIDADGQKLGRVVDIVLSDDGSWYVTGLELGRYGWFDRFNLTRPLTQYLKQRPNPPLVRWEDVESFEGFMIRLKDGAGQSASTG